MKEKRIKLAEIDPKVVSKEIGDFVIKTNLRTGSTGSVIGLSGGVDSTVSATLINKAYQEYNLDHEKRLELVGYILPTNINMTKDNTDGIKVAEKLGVRYEVVDIEELVQAHQTTNPKAFLNKYDKGNMISRIRANVLSTKAASENKNVAGTGNKDEDFGIGYYTLFGDGAVHFSPIGGLSKRLVKQMANYLNFPEVANRTPTAGLEIGQTDFGDLGYSYNLVELVIEGLESGIPIRDLQDYEQIDVLAQFERNLYEETFSKSKFDTTYDQIKDIERRHLGAMKKVEIISPPVAEITLKYK